MIDIIGGYSFFCQGLSSTNIFQYASLVLPLPELVSAKYGADDELVKPTSYCKMIFLSGTRKTNTPDGEQSLL